MRVKHFIGVTLAVLFSCVALFGQAVSTSQVSGVVQDQSGAVIPSAEVQMRGTDTGLVRTAITDANGYYTIQELPIGPYTLRVTKEGFNTYVQNGISLQVGVNPTINATLQIGSQMQQVVVEANANMVETESTGIGQVINNKQVEDLPLNGREVAQLVTLSGLTAASGNSVGDLNSNKNYGAGSANMANAVVTDSVAGGQGNTVAFVMDGGINNDPRNNLNSALPFPDAIQEFNVQTSSLSARYGQNSTAAVNIVTKNGTNSFHGDAFEYVRNFLFNARPANAPVRDSLKRNQFGGVLGGPIKRDKLFFFGGYQGTILKSNPSTNTVDVPTAAELSGDFSAVTANATLCGLTPGVLLNQVTDPKANPNLPEFNSSNKYVGNLGPWQVNPLVQTILKYIPAAPTTGSLAQTACGQINVPLTQNLTDKETIGRVDYNMNSKNTWFVRYFIAINSQPVTWDGQDFLELNKVATYERDQELTIGETYTIRPNLINNVRFTANRDLNLRTTVPVPFGGPQHDPQGLTGTGGDCTANPSAADCSLQVASLQPDYFDMAVRSTPSTTSTSAFSFLGGANNPGYFNNTLFQLADDVDWVRGKHQISVGFDYIFSVANTVNTQTANGIIVFSGLGLSDPNSKSGAGIGYADFEQGLLTPSSFTQANLVLDNEWAPYYGAYISDNWKLRRNFSIQAGIRYEPYIQEKNINDHVSNFQLPAFVALEHTKVYVNAPDGLFFNGDPGYPGASNSQSHYDRWAPRVGLVWDPKGDGKTSIRAGFGWFNNAAELFNYSHEAANPPWGDAVTASTNASAVVPFNNPWVQYPGGNPFPGVTHLSPTSAFPANAGYTNQPINMAAPYEMQWNLSVQHQVGSWLFAANYIGSAGRHLQSGYQLDPTVFVPGVAGAFNSAASSSISGFTGVNCTVGASSTQSGVFLTGPFAGLSDGLTSAYPVGDPCSAAGSAMTAPFAASKTTNYTQRQLFYENAYNVSGQASQFSGVPQMDPGATSNYNGLLLSANHRFSHNFTLLANYTYSHCADLPTQDEWQGGTEYPALQPISPSQPNFSLRSLAYHNCDSDERHVANVSLIASTPKFSNKWLNAIAGGWQASVISVFHTGNYSSVTTGVDTSFTNQSALAYAQQVGNNQYAANKLHPTSSNSCTLGPTGTCVIQEYYLNTSDYAAQAPGTFGTSWAQTVEAPSFFNVDTALSRTFKIKESKSLQIRWETFNFDNHVNYAAPTTTMSSGTFGLVTGTLTGTNPRIMQFATKFVF